MNKRGSEAEAGAAEASVNTGEAANETSGGRKGRRMRGRGVEEEAELQEQATAPAGGTDEGTESSEGWGSRGGKRRGGKRRGFRSRLRRKPEETNGDLPVNRVA